MDLEQSIDKIRKNYETINRNKDTYTYKKYVYPAEDYDIEANGDTIFHEAPYKYIEYYLDKENLMLICFNQEGSEGLISTTRHEFYIWDGKLVFTFRKHMEIAYENSIASSLEELRGYYHNEKLIRLLGKELEQTGGKSAIDSLSRYTINEELVAEDGEWLKEFFEELKQYTVKSE